MRSLTSMSYLTKRRGNYITRLKSVVNILEKDLGMYPHIHSFSRSISNDESVEITVMRKDPGTNRVVIDVDGHVVLDDTYKRYSDIQNAIMCNRIVHHLIMSKGVAI